MSDPRGGAIRESAPPGSGQHADIEAEQTRVAHIRARLESVYSKAVISGSLILIAGYVAWSQGGFVKYTATVAAVYGIVTLGNNLLLGHAGVLSLGQGGLMAVSSYGATIVGNRYQLNWIEAAVVGIGAATLAGIIIALPSLRLSGHYFAIITLIFALAVEEILTNLRTITGGASGLSVNESVVIPPDLIYWLAFAILCILCVHQIWFLTTTRGVELREIRDSEHAALAIGVNVPRYKIGAFAYSGVLAGIGGVLLASTVGYLSPVVFDMFLSFFILAAVVLGGMGSPLGCVIGAAIVAVVPQETSGLQGLSSVILGLAVLVMLFIMARGGKFPGWLMQQIRQTTRFESEK